MHVHQLWGGASRNIVSVPLLPEDAFAPSRSQSDGATACKVAQNVSLTRSLSSRKTVRLKSARLQYTLTPEACNFRSAKFTRLERTEKLWRAISWGYE